MLVRMGYIGNTHGVNARPMPSKKNPAKVAILAPSVSFSARVFWLDTGMLLALSPDVTLAAMFELLLAAALDEVSDAVADKGNKGSSLVTGG